MTHAQLAKTNTFPKMDSAVLVQPNLQQTVSHVILEHVHNAKMDSLSRTLLVKAA